jgi:glyoxylate/hydroxypyruvate reductase A
MPMTLRTAQDQDATVAVAIGDSARAAEWQAALIDAAPDFTIVRAEAMAAPAVADFAVVWRAPLGMLSRFPRLKAVLSLGAGVDGILSNRELEPGVPVVRMVDEALTQGMVEYVLWHVLRYQRRAPELLAAQRRQEWLPIAAPLASERCVGVMGLGVLGEAAARRLTAIGFRVKGWSRTPRQLDGIETFSGTTGLAGFLGGVEILICFLPLTPETENILAAPLFAALAPGAFLINAARGEHLVEADLLEALAAGRLAGATLDAFRTEPLPADHPFWKHPAITVTPHVASLTRAASGARHLAAEMRRILAGEAPLHAARRDRGY